jgi:hypothetical protein
MFSIASFFISRMTRWGRVREGEREKKREPYEWKSSSITRSNQAQTRDMVEQKERTYCKEAAGQKRIFEFFLVKSSLLYLFQVWITEDKIN